MKKVAVLRVGEVQSPAPQLDVVFIHGLHGDAKKTWSSGMFPSKFWPEWIAKDQRLHVWAVDYPTLITDWTGEQKLTLPQLANSIAFALLERGIGARPLVFVGHSMGGLVAKEIIAQGRFPQRAAEPLRAACASVVFYGTPHKGAKLVELLTDWTGDAIDIDKTHLHELRPGTQYLGSLNTAFGYWLSHRKSSSELTAFRETQRYLGQMVVPKDSADPDLGAAVRVVDLAGEDHVSMCKVKGEDDERVLHLRRLCHEVCSQAWQSAGKSGCVLLSYHWDDTGSLEAVRRVQAALEEAGIPVIADITFRDRFMAPKEGWLVWRAKAMHRAHALVLFCGTNHLAASDEDPPGHDEYFGLVFSPQEVSEMNGVRMIPVLPDGQTDRGLVPPWAKNFYNGMRLPAHLPQLIAALCAIEPAHRDLEDQ